MIFKQEMIKVAPQFEAAAVSLKRSRDMIAELDDGLDDTVSKFAGTAEKIQNAMANAHEQQKVTENKMQAVTEKAEAELQNIKAKAEAERTEQTALHQKRMGDLAADSQMSAMHRQLMKEVYDNYFESRLEALQKYLKTKRTSARGMMKCLLPFDTKLEKMVALYKQSYNVTDVHF
jgi:uncharacterized membrane protein YqiK